MPSSPPPAFVHRRIVEFHETDVAGLAHFSNFFRWMETTELAFLREHAIPAFTAGVSGQRGWPRASACAQFKAPLRFGDEIEVRLRVLAVGRACVRYGFEIWRLAGPGAPELAATGELASVHATRPRSGGQLRPAPLLPATRTKLVKFVDPQAAKAGQ